MELNMRAQTQKVADQSSHHHSDAYAAERPTPPRNKDACLLLLQLDGHLLSK